MTFVRGWNGSLRERFERKLTRMQSGCLEWTGGRNLDGYGKIWLDGATIATHRLAWEIANDTPVPDGLLILHSCDNPPCCEPTHLRPGTGAENSADMIDRGRGYNQQKTHCIHGHEYTDDNTSLRASGTRRCQACHRIEERVANQRKRAMA